MAYTPERRKEYDRDRIARRKEQYGLTDPKCVACGSTDKIEWDHTDPSTKRGSLGCSIAWLLLHGTDKALQRELPLVQPLCRKCHKAKISVWLLRNGEIRSVKDIGRNTQFLLDGAQWLGWAIGGTDPLFLHYTSPFDGRTQKRVVA